MATDLTAECIAGYDDPEGASPHMATSPCDDAHRIGQWLRRTGRPRPRDCRRSRGSRYRVGDLVVEARWQRRPGSRSADWTAERVA